MDHLDIHRLVRHRRGRRASRWSCRICRVVAGTRAALLEAALAQVVFLVLFSYAFFFEGYTGLTVTVGAIVTLFVLMQMTARVDWAAVFARRQTA